MPRRLVLWDVDGTLVDSGGVGGQMFDVALERVLGTRPAVRVRMSGKTDPQIVNEYLEALEVAHADRTAHLEKVLAHLAEAVAAEEDEIRRRGRVLPGVVEALTALGRHDDVGRASSRATWHRTPW